MHSFRFQRQLWKSPRRQYVWWRGSWWTWAYGGWYLYTEARQSQEPNRNTHAAGDRSICRGPAGSWRDGFGGTTTVSTRSIPDWMHRLPSRTASGGHCVPAPEAVDRIASQPSACSGQRAFRHWQRAQLLAVSKAGRHLVMRGFAIRSPDTRRWTSSEPTRSWPL